MLKIVETTVEGKLPATLDDLAREGARQMLMKALEAEVSEYVERHRAARGEDGRALVVRNGHARARQVTTGAGTVEVQAPRVDDQRSGHRFTSSILPPYMRRSPKVDEVLPVLYLRGLSTGDFKEALGALLGDKASGLSPSSIARMTATWEEEYRSIQATGPEREGLRLRVGGRCALPGPPGGGPPVHVGSCSACATTGRRR